MKNIAFFCEYARNGQRNGRFISCRSEQSPPETATVRRGIRSTCPEVGKADSDSSGDDDAETPPIYLEVDSDITFNFASNLETVHSGQGYFSHFLPSLPSRSQFVVILVGCQRSRLSSVPSIPTQACSYVSFLSSPKKFFFKNCPTFFVFLRRECCHEHQNIANFSNILYSKFKTLQS